MMFLPGGGQVASSFRFPKLMFNVFLCVVDQMIMLCWMLMCFQDERQQCGSNIDRPCQVASFSTNLKPTTNLPTLRLADKNTGQARLSSCLIKWRSYLRSEKKIITNIFALSAAHARTFALFKCELFLQIIRTGRGGCFVFPPPHRFPNQPSSAASLRVLRPCLFSKHH